MVKKVLGVLLVLGLAAAALIYVFVWNKPHRSLLDEKAAFEGTTEQFAKTFFEAPEAMHDSLFDKVIALSGKVGAAERTGDSTIQISFLTPEAEILCGFSGEAGFALKDPTPGTELRLRGIYTGYTEGLPGFDDMLPTLTLNRCIHE